MDVELLYLAQCLDQPEVLTTYPVAEELFTTPRRRAAHRAIRDLAEMGRCSRIVLSRMEGWQPFVIGLPLAWEYETDHLVRQLRDQAIRRSLQRVSIIMAEAVKDEVEPWQETRDRTVSMLNRIGDDEGTDSSVLLAEIARDTLSSVERTMEQGFQGIGTGFALLDRIIGGWEPQKLYLVAARPGEGKTAFVLQSAIEAAYTGEVYVASLEMGGLQVGTRLLSGKAKIDSLDLRRKGAMDAAKMDRLRMAVDSLGRLPIIVDCRAGTTVERLRGDVLRRVARRGLSLLAVDYLQLLRSSERTGGKWEELGIVAQTLKELAKEASIPIIAAVQINRGPAEANTEPGLHNLRGSGDLEQAADVVITLWRPDENQRERVKVTVKKNRDGPVGHFFASFQPEFTLFE